QRLDRAEPRRPHPRCPLPVTAKVHVFNQRVLSDPVRHVRLLHSWVNAALRTSPRLLSRFRRLSPCLPEPPRWATWPRFTFHGFSGGNVIVECFDLLGKVACMAVSSSPSGTSPLSPPRTNTAWGISPGRFHALRGPVI